MSQLVNIDQTDMIIANIGANTKTLAQLNTDYPNAKKGQEVHSDTELYKKTSTGWIIMTGENSGSFSQELFGTIGVNSNGSGVILEGSSLIKRQTVVFDQASYSLSYFNLELYNEINENHVVRAKELILINQSNIPIRIVPSQNPLDSDSIFYYGATYSEYYLYPKTSIKLMYDSIRNVWLIDFNNNKTQTASFTGTNANQSASFTPSVSGNFNILGGFLISKDSGWYTLFDFRKDGVSQLGWNRRCDDNPSNDAQGRQELLPINLVNVPLIAGSIYSLHVSMSTGVSTYNRLLGGQFSNLKIELA